MSKDGEDEKVGNGDGFVVVTLMRLRERMKTNREVGIKVSLKDLKTSMRVNHSQKLSYAQGVSLAWWLGRTAVC